LIARLVSLESSSTNGELISGWLAKIDEQGSLKNGVRREVERFLSSISSHKKGWKRLERVDGMNLFRHLSEMEKRDDVSETDKRRAAEILASADEKKRVKAGVYDEAMKLVLTNKTTKRERTRKALVADTFVNAVSMACQACENLNEDIQVPPLLPLGERLRMIARLNGSVRVLMSFQAKLIEEGEDE
jgi:hypothetical protein